MFNLCTVFVFLYIKAAQAEPELAIRQHYDKNILPVVSSITVPEGDNFFLECLLMDNGKLLNGETTWGKQTLESDVILRDSCLHFTSISPDDQGIYFCENSEHNLRKIISLTVIIDQFKVSKKPPCEAEMKLDKDDYGVPQIVITQHYHDKPALVVESLAVTEGDNIMLKCALMDKGKEPDYETTWGKQTSESDVILKNTCLHFTSISHDDEGIYFCENPKHNLRKVISLTVMSDIQMPSCSDELGFYD